MPQLPQPSARRASRGFSLVEMLVVVVITSVLALVGVVLFRKYLWTSKGAEASSVIQALRAAEEQYLAENHVYLNVSTGTNWYPTLVPGVTGRAWKVPSGGHPDADNWAALGAVVNRTVQFGYLANAGIAGVARTTLSTQAAVVWPSVPTDNWYVLQARGDVNGNGITSQYAATELNGELYVENEGE